MSLISSSFVTGSTIAVSGGTALPLGSKGQQGNAVVLYATGDADIRTRRDFVFSSVDAKVNSVAPNGYTQSRRKMVYKAPLSLDNLGLTVNTATIELRTDVETTAAEKLEYRKMLAQALIDPALVQYWDNGSLA